MRKTANSVQQELLWEKFLEVKTEKELHEWLDLLLSQTESKDNMVMVLSNLLDGLKAAEEMNNKLHEQTRSGIYKAMQAVKFMKRVLGVVNESFYTMHENENFIEEAGWAIDPDGLEVVRKYVESDLWEFLNGILKGRY